MSIEFVDTYIAENCPNVDVVEAHATLSISGELIMSRYVATYLLIIISPNALMLPHVTMVQPLLTSQRADSIALKCNINKCNSA